MAAIKNSSGKANNPNRSRFSNTDPRTMGINTNTILLQCNRIYLKRLFPLLFASAATTTLGHRHRCQIKAVSTAKQPSQGWLLTKRSHMLVNMQKTLPSSGQGCRGYNYIVNTSSSSPVSSVCLHSRRHDIRPASPTLARRTHTLALNAVQCCFYPRNYNSKQFGNWEL